MKRPKKFIIVEQKWTWKNQMPILVEVLTNKAYTPKSKKIAIQELMRLAVEVDKINGKTITK